MLGNGCLVHTSASAAAAALNPDVETARVSTCKSFMGGLATSGTFAVARFMLQFARTGFQRMLRDPTVPPTVRRVNAFFQWASQSLLRNSRDTQPDVCTT